MLRQTVLARRLAAAAGLTAREQRQVCYVSLLAWVGCIADSHELAVVSNADLDGTVQLWEWIGDGATTFSF